MKYRREIGSVRLIDEFSKKRSRFYRNTQMHSVAWLFQTKTKPKSRVWERGQHKAEKLVSNHGMYDMA